MTYLLVVVLLTGDIYSIRMPREVDGHDKCVAVAKELIKPIRDQVKQISCHKHIYKEV